MNKYTVVLVAYKDIPIDVEKKIKERMLRNIKSADEVNLSSSLVGLRGSMNSNSRSDIYLDWYRNSIREYLKKGYEIAILELHYDINNERMAVIKYLDEEYGDNLLVIECDNL